jgi:hypothetical protein
MQVEGGRVTERRESEVIHSQSRELGLMCTTSQRKKLMADELEARTKMCF